MLQLQLLQLRPQSCSITTTTSIPRHSSIYVGQDYATNSLKRFSSRGGEQEKQGTMVGRHATTHVMHSTGCSKGACDRREDRYDTASCNCLSNAWHLRFHEYHSAAKSSFCVRWRRRDLYTRMCLRCTCSSGSVRTAKASLCWRHEVHIMGVCRCFRGQEYSISGKREFKRTMTRARRSV